MEGWGDTWTMPADTLCDGLHGQLGDGAGNQMKITAIGTGEADMGRYGSLTVDGAGIIKARWPEKDAALRERMLEFAIRNGAHNTAKNIVENAATFEAFVLNGTNNASTPSE